MPNLSIIKQTPLFKELSEEALAFLDGHAIARTFQADEVVAAEGSLGDCMFIIKSGALDVVLSRGAPGMVKIARLSPGDFVGEISLIDSQPRSASIVASKDAEVLIINRQALLDLHEVDFKAFMKVIVNITRKLGERLRETDKVIAGISK